MSDETSKPARTFSIDVDAGIDDTWHALTRQTVLWWFGNSIRSTWIEGDAITFLGPDGEPDIFGNIIAIDVPSRLAMTFRPVWSDAASELPEGRLDWILSPAGGGTRLTLEHRGLAMDSPMEAEIVDGWRHLLGRLKSLVDAVPPTQFRAVFDAEIVFSNGGGLQAQDFRIDIPDSDTPAVRIGELFVASLDLLMTETATVQNLRIVEEAHKGTRGGPSDPRDRE